MHKDTRVLPEQTHSATTTGTESSPSADKFTTGKPSHLESLENFLLETFRKFQDIVVIAELDGVDHTLQALN
eukprot:3595398-Rhodomonas_salina.1